MKQKLKLHKTPSVVRVEIVERGNVSKTLSLEEDSPQSVLNTIKDFLNREHPFHVPINPFAKPIKVQIVCYNAQGTKRKNHIGCTLHGLSVEYIYTEIVENLLID